MAEALERDEYVEAHYILRYKKEILEGVRELMDRTDMDENGREYSWEEKVKNCSPAARIAFLMLSGVDFDNYDEFCDISFVEERIKVGLHSAEVTKNTRYLFPEMREEAGINDFAPDSTGIAQDSLNYNKKEVKEFFEKILVRISPKPETVTPKIYNGTAHDIDILAGEDIWWDENTLKYKTTAENPTVIATIPRGKQQLGVTYETEVFGNIGGTSVPDIKKTAVSTNQLPAGYDLYVVSPLFYKTRKEGGRDISKLRTVQNVVFDSTERVRGCLSVGQV